MEDNYVNAGYINWIVTFVCYANPMVGSLNWLRPIVCGSLTGLVLGDPQTGCIVGATLELAFLGSYAIERSTSSGLYGRYDFGNSICNYIWS